MSFEYLFFCAERRFSSSYRVQTSAWGKDKADNVSVLFVFVGAWRSPEKGRNGSSWQSDKEGSTESWFTLSQLFSVQSSQIIGRSEDTIKDCANKVIWGYICIFYYNISTHSCLHHFRSMKINSTLRFNSTRKGNKRMKTKIRWSQGLFNSWLQAQVVC